MDIRCPRNTFKKVFSSVLPRHTTFLFALSSFIWYSIYILVMFTCNVCENVKLKTQL
jgi:hypothetical protein